mmetsp:Transcript_14403/g.41453  ORF Transcript_14403/g.41453 Transcript_14403/m.41453 type:complete len:608 (-) Transcript_14403:133-1956(-)
MLSFEFSRHQDVEQQPNRIVIVDVDPRLAAVVLQSEAGMIRSLTKDNFIDALKTLEYFTGGITEDTLRLIVTQIFKPNTFLDDSEWVAALVDSYDQPPISRLLCQLADTQLGMVRSGGLAERVLDSPEQLQPVYNRVPEDEGRQAATALVSHLTQHISLVEPSAERVETFLTIATKSPTLQDALYKVFADRHHALHTTTTITPFDSDERAACVPFRDVTAIPTFLRARHVASGVKGWRDRPEGTVCRCTDKNRCRCRRTLQKLGGAGYPDRKVVDVASWQVLASPGLTSSSPGGAPCFSISGAFTVEPPKGNQAPVTLHTAARFASSVGLHLSGVENVVAVEVDNLAVGKLVESGAADAVLKDVRLTLTVARHPYATLALQYLGRCIKDERWAAVNKMARSVGGEVQVAILGHMCHMAVGTVERPLALLLHWCEGMNDMTPGMCHKVASSHCLTKHPSSTEEDVRAFVKHVIPLMVQDQAQQEKAYRAVAANLLLPTAAILRLVTEAKADRDLLRYSRRESAAKDVEIARLRAEIARLKAELGRASRDGVVTESSSSNALTSNRAGVDDRPAHVDSGSTASAAPSASAEGQDGGVASPEVFIFGRRY